jgi:molybdopterin converting factor small subunit
VFSTCDVNFWYFCVATFLTLPKQIILVYLGVLFVNQQTGTVEKGLIFGVGGAATVALGVYVWWKMGAIKKMLLEEQAERRAQRMAERELNGSSTSVVVKDEPELTESDEVSLMPLRGGSSSRR